MAQQRLIFFVCDHPGCGRSVEGRNQMAQGMTTPVSGYHGTIKLNNENQLSDRAARWFACRKTHVSGAIKTALEKVHG